MRIKHYLLILLVLLMIAFMQPLIVFLGNLLLIVAAGAYIYSDMTPEAQARYEHKLTDLLDRARHGLRSKRPSSQQLTPSRGGRLRRMLGGTPKHETRVEPATVESVQPERDSERVRTVSIDHDG